MGNKSGWTRKFVLLCFAFGGIMVAVYLAACAPVQSRIAGIREHRQLEQYRKDMAAGSFETVIQQSRKIIEQSETESPANIAFYVLGEIYAQNDYAGRDYALSQYYFEKLTENFPHSPLTAEAKTYISLFETIAAKEKAAAAAEQKFIQLEIPAAKKKEALSPSRPRLVVENQNFAEAVKKNLQILKEAGASEPADKALYNLGLIYAHVDNPAKDYKKSQTYFQTLTDKFPDSELSEEARIWLGLFATIEKIQQIDMEIEEQKKQLNR